MGGFGSGGRIFHGAKTIVEHRRWIDVRLWQQGGFLTPGRVSKWKWPTAAIGVLAESERVVLFYRHRYGDEEWQSVECVVLLERTPCNYGGNRTWFSCPKCSRRVAILYLGGRIVGCRRCYNLVYQSQRLDWKSRALRRAQSIRERLGATVNMFEPFPDKPKGMHWRTYDRLRALHDGASIGHLAGVVRTLGLQISA